MEMQTRRPQIMHSLKLRLSMRPQLHQIGMIETINELFEEWWKLLPRSAYPEEIKELFLHTYTMGYKEGNLNASARLQED